MPSTEKIGIATQFPKPLQNIIDCCWDTTKMEAKIAKLSKELYENQSSLNPELFGDGDDDLFRYNIAL